MKAKMNKIRFCKILFSLALTVLSVQVRAQVTHGFGAKNNNYISALIPPGQPNVDVTLGNPDDTDPDVQYEWKLVKVNKEHYQCSFSPGWPNTRMPVATLDYGLWLFQVTRASKYGIQTENVVVNVSNDIKVKAKPKDGRCCWSNGEEIKLSQFDITTEPPGYENLVDLSENSRKAQHWAESPETEQIITFKAIEGCEYPVYGQTSINVVEGHVYVQGNIVADRGLIRAIDALESIRDVKGMKNRFKEVEAFLKPVSKLGPFDYDYNVGGAVNLYGGCECCCGTKHSYVGINANLYGSVSVMATFTPFVAFPPLKIKFGVEGGISLTLADFKVSGSVFDDGECGCSLVDLIPFSVYIEIMGGVALESPVADLLSVTGLVVGGVTGVLNYNIKDGWNASDYNCYLKLRAKACLLFARYQMEYYLID